MYTVLDLFCGAGGFSLGFQQAGYKIAGGIDFDVDALKTYRINIATGQIYYKDITKMTKEEITTEFEGVDIIIGGCPCQGFSVANRNQKEKDPRNSLYKEILRVVEVLNPKAVVIENVRQILTKNNGEIKNNIINTLTELGYNVDVQVLNASDYGVPQTRQRAIFIAVKKEYGEVQVNHVKKAHCNVTVGEAIGELFELEGKDDRVLSTTPKTWYQQYLRAKTNEIYDHYVVYPNAKVQQRMKYVPQGGNWKDVPPELFDKIRTNRHSNSYKRLNMDTPSITIDTGHGSYFHPVYNRWLTVRESARLQSFPDYFLFWGNKTSQFKQVGNAVPPLLARAIAILLQNILNCKE